jgi:hypothetical protein
MRAVNNNGNANFYKACDSGNNNYLGDLTVLPATHAACLAGGSALLNSLGGNRAWIDAEIAANAAKATEAAARLADAQPVIDQIKAQWAETDIPPYIEMTTPLVGLPTAVMDDILGDYRYVMSSGLYQVCPSSPPTTYGDAKKIQLTDPSGLTSWGDALGPSGNQAVWFDSNDLGVCSEIRLSSAIPIGGTYAINFYNAVSNSNIVLTAPFKTKSITFSPRPQVTAIKATRYELGASYVYGDNAPPMLWDTIKFHDKDDVVADTVYTWCNCRNAPTAGSITARTIGVASTATLYAPKVAIGQPTRAPYTAKLHRANTEAVVATVAPNVVWGKLSV